MKKVSGIIVVRNEENYIIDSMTSLINQEFDDIEYEVLIIDGESSDQTINLIEKFIKSNTSKIPIKLISNPKKTLASGWNLALKNIKSEFIFRIDAHSKIPNNYIMKCLEVLDNNPDVFCVGGRLNSIVKNRENDVISQVLSSPFGVGNSRFRYSKTSGYVDTIAYGLYRVESFIKCGYFNENLTRNQDLDFHSRMKKYDMKFYLIGDLEVLYYTRNTFSKFVKQAFQNGKWNIILFKSNPKALSLRHLIPFIFILYLASIIILIIWYPQILYIYLIGLYVYLLLALAFSLLKTKYLPKTLLMICYFLILHISYGVGSLRGIFSRG